MNYRISKKIYKRADLKLKSFIAANHDKRTTYDIAKEENILSDLERSIFISKQDKWTKRINDIVDELKAEEASVTTAAAKTYAKCYGKQTGITLNIKDKEETTCY